MPQTSAEGSQKRATRCFRSSKLRACSTKKLAKSLGFSFHFARDYTVVPWLPYITDGKHGFHQQFSGFLGDRLNYSSKRTYPTDGQKYDTVRGIKFAGIGMVLSAPMTDRPQLGFSSSSERTEKRMNDEV